jgi:hypothetical protein
MCGMLLAYRRGLLGAGYSAGAGTLRGIDMILLACVEGASIAFDAGFELGELAVGRALGGAEDT